VVDKCLNSDYGRGFDVPLYLDKPSTLLANLRKIVIAVLILFSRNHNAIAYSLWSVNEAEKYGDWDDLTDEQKEW
jgi:hypothetical protein